MKPIQSIKYLLLLIPFNTLAHPGHDDIVTQSGGDRFRQHCYRDFHYVCRGGRDGRTIATRQTTVYQEKLTREKDG